MSELYNIANIFLFGILVGLTLIFGKVNINHLKKLFVQYEEINTIQFRPIVLLNFTNMDFEFSNDRKLNNGKDALSYHKTTKPQFFRIWLYFSIENKGKMVARTVRVDCKTLWPDHDLIRADKIQKNDFDLPPMDNDSIMIGLRCNEFKNFAIQVILTWEYGKNHMGKIKQHIRLDPEKNITSYLTKNVNLDYKNFRIVQVGTSNRYYKVSNSDPF